MEPPAEMVSAGLPIRTVVVGVDGSDESISALNWAARMTEPDGTVYAVAAISPVRELAVAAVQVNSATVVARLAERLEDEWTQSVRSTGRTVICDVIEADPADSLMQVGERVAADIIAVGVHPKPTHGPRTVGRVTTKLIQRTDRPLAIVEADGEVGAEGATVVVSADHGAATEAAVRWAAAFADVHGTDLSLLRSTPNRPSLGPDGLLDVLAFYIDRSMLREWATHDLARLAEELQNSTERNLEISWSAAVGPIGPRLIEAGSNASLIVVGRAVRRGPAHTLTNELRHVIVHAPCPVVVVPPAN